MSTRIALLLVRLKGFEQPNTRSQLEGRLDPGRYVVLDERRSAEVDFARVLVPAFGAGDTWVCTRWRDQVYAELRDEPPPAPPSALTFGADERTVPESRLRDLTRKFHRYTYDLDDAYYPYRLRGAKVPLTRGEHERRTNNCCTFVEALVAKAWLDEHPDFRWSAEKHRQMMIMSSDDFFSPVTAAVEAGIAVPTPQSASPLPWTIIQGWRSQWRGGHTFLIVAHHRATDRVLTLESNSSYGLNGPGWRKIGNLRDCAAPPEDWWQDESLWTWQKLISTYRFNRYAALKVTDLEWGRV